MYMNVKNFYVHSEDYIHVLLFLAALIYSRG